MAKKTDFEKGWANDEAIMRRLAETKDLNEIFSKGFALAGLICAEAAEEFDGNGSTLEPGNLKRLSSALARHTGRLLRISNLLSAVAEELGSE